MFKAIIEAVGLQPPNTHDLGELLVYVNNQDFKYSETDILNSIVMFVNRWEATSRYNSEIEVYASQLKLVHEHIDRLSKEFLNWMSLAFSKMKGAAVLENDTTKLLQQLKDNL